MPLRLSRPLVGGRRRALARDGHLGFFAHDSPDGSAVLEARPALLRPGGNGSWSVGENLLWSTTGARCSRCAEAWMDSAGHRKNILTPSWREVGLSAVSVPAAPGVFGGRDVVIITTDFGAAP